MKAPFASRCALAVALPADGCATPYAYQFQPADPVPGAASTPSDRDVLEDDSCESGRDRRLLGGERYAAESGTFWHTSIRGGRDPGEATGGKRRQFRCGPPNLKRGDRSDKMRSSTVHFGAAADRRVLAIAALVLGSAFACGGKSQGAGDVGTSSGSGSGSSGGSSSSGGSGSGSGSSGGSSSSGGSGSGGGSSGAVVQTGCPVSPPAVGVPCTGSLTCQYGTDPDVQCDTVSTCNAGYWFMTAASGGPLCPTSQPGQNGCPASYPAGQSCAGEGAGCAYFEGVCACENPDPVVVQGEDAGLTWECAVPSAGCPNPRPQPGTYCGNVGEVCTYGDCITPGGPVEMTCTSTGGGEWALTVESCAE